MRLLSASLALLPPAVVDKVTAGGYDTEPYP